MINVVLADDHSVFRNGLSALLKSDSAIKIIAEASNGEEAYDKILAFKPQIAIIDITMPKLNGLELCRKLQSENNPTKIIILTMHNEGALVNEAIQSGASAYILKDNTYDELVSAIYAVQQDKIFISQQLRNNFNTNDVQFLSEREKQVLICISDGKTNKETAKFLNISPKTIETYRARLMKKLQVNNMAGLIKYAVKMGLV